MDYFWLYLVNIYRFIMKLLTVEQWRGVSFSYAQHPIGKIRPITPDVKTITLATKLSLSEAIKILTKYSENYSKTRVDHFTNSPFKIKFQLLNVGSITDDITEEELNDIGVLILENSHYAMLN